MSELGRLPNQYLVAAQKELEAQGKLVTVTVKNQHRKSTEVIRPSWLRYAAEEGEGNP